MNANVKVANPYYQILVVHPLLIIASLLYGLQAVRYLLIKQFYILMPSMVGIEKKGKQLTLRKLSIFEKFTSRITFTIVSLVVMSIVYVIEITFIICGVVLNNLESLHKASEMISDIFTALIGVIALVSFISDLIIWVRFLNQKKHKFTFCQHLVKYYQDDPLVFRWEMLIVFMGIIFGVPTVIIDLTGLAGKNIVVKLVRELLIKIFLFLLLAMSGLFVSVVAFWYYVKKFRNKTEENDKDLLKSVLDDPLGLELLSDYARSEWSLENILLYEEIQAYKNLRASQKLSERVKEILHNYIEANSVLEVNVPDSLRRNLAESLNDTSYVWDSESLNSLESIVLQNLTDTFMRFKKTAQYSMYLKMKKMAKRYSFAVNKQ